MKKLLVFFLSLILLLYLIPAQVFAENNFKTDYSVTYNVLENALTHVTFDITLTNTTSQYYASSYSVQVGFKNIDNVLAQDSGGKIIPQLTENDDGRQSKTSDHLGRRGIFPFLAAQFQAQIIILHNGQAFDLVHYREP